jgi:uncharacterized DUF497 family protein
MPFFEYYDIIFDNEKDARQRWVDNGKERFPFTDYAVMVKEFEWSEGQHVFKENFDPETQKPYSDGETRFNMVGKFKGNYHLVTFVFRGERDLRIISGHPRSDTKAILGPRTDMPQAAPNRRAKVNLARAVITVTRDDLLGLRTKPKK